jgi:hypothetical protein
MDPLLGIRRIEALARGSRVTLLRAVPSKTHFSADVSCAISGPASAQTAARPAAQADHSVTATYHLPRSDSRIFRQLLPAETMFSSLHAIASQVAGKLGVNEV